MTLLPAPALRRPTTTTIRRRRTKTTKTTYPSFVPTATMMLLVWLSLSLLLQRETCRAFVILEGGGGAGTATGRRASGPGAVAARTGTASTWRRQQQQQMQQLRKFQLNLSQREDEDDEAATTATATASAARNEPKSDVRVDAESALASAGWMTLPEEGELTSDDPFVQMIDAGIRRDVGVSLDELLNPAKVVNLERDLVRLRTQLAERTGKSLGGTAESSSSSDAPVLSNTAECDGGGGGPEADELRSKIAKKESDLATERRSVFQGWLKTVFLVQAAVSFALSFVMATRPDALFGGFDWFANPRYNMDISVKVLGYWWWWLFVVPSLRSRRPKGPEKKALDLAFVGTPLVSLLMPVVTTDTGVIWFANFAFVAASYGYAFVLDNDDDDEGDDDDDDDAGEDGSDAKTTPDWLKFVYKSLDFGSGRERGARK